jgi:hypothetical protein
MSLSTLPEMSGPGTEDAQRYASCMAEVRQRLEIARNTVAKVRAAGQEDVASTEVIFIQLRKCTELIVFGSLIAHKDSYSQHYADFRNDGRAKKLVEHLEKINPAFYPVPMSAPVKTGPSSFTIADMTEPFLTKEDLVHLFDIASRILHIRNPFLLDDPTLNIEFSVDEWIGRIHTLLKWHYIQQTHGPRWLVEIPDVGPVHVYPSAPV